MALGDSALVLTDRRGSDTDSVLVKGDQERRPGMIRRVYELPDDLVERIEARRLLIGHPQFASVEHEAGRPTFWKDRAGTVYEIPKSARERGC